MFDYVHQLVANISLFVAGWVLYSRFIKTAAAGNEVDESSETKR